MNQSAGPRPAPFGARLRAAMDTRGPLCVGIDPHPHLLAAWNLPDTAAGLARFCRTAVEALAGRVAIVKPQSALFERHGSAGIAVLEELLAGLRERATLSLLDAKRGDIGSTMAAYADAYTRADSPLRADALTASPYLGFESLRPLLDAARAAGTGVFVLGLTSNPEGAAVQHARDRAGRAVAATIADHVRADNAGDRPLGSVGLVVGATVGAAAADLGIDLAATNAPLLCPGIGAQGGDPAGLGAVFGPAIGNVLPSASREVLAAGPHAHRLAQAADRLTEQCRRAVTPPADGAE
ncbi:MAG: orotidine-5'-phosphate decarboxylase [Micrococcales bacterium]|nr:MAG: orotidine-5'-phosphate decarboxylase [Micrococcales bacterium]